MTEVSDIERQDLRGWAARQHHRTEDLRWMAGTGESLSGAARRLGLRTQTLERWAVNNCPDVLRLLRRNEPSARSTGGKA